MRDVVLDASVVLKWFRDKEERHVAQARAVRAAFEHGDLFVYAPPLLGLEIVNVAGRRWGWPHESLTRLASAIDELGFETVLPSLAEVARWTALGLTAYDAAYVGVAQALSIDLITDDELVLDIARGVAVPLSSEN